MPGTRVLLECHPPAASSEEAAAIAAAIDLFMRETASSPLPVVAAESPWLRAALLEATERTPEVPATWR